MRGTFKRVRDEIKDQLNDVIDEYDDSCNYVTHMYQVGNSGEYAGRRPLSGEEQIFIVDLDDMESDS